MIDLNYLRLGRWLTRLVRRSEEGRLKVGANFVIDIGRSKEYKISHS
jgi:hypothetical protein